MKDQVTQYGLVHQRRSRFSDHLPEYLGPAAGPQSLECEALHLKLFSKIQSKPNMLSVTSSCWPSEPEMELSFFGLKFEPKKIAPL